jgi:hypothetical protein
VPHDGEHCSMVRSATRERTALHGRAEAKHCTVELRHPECALSRPNQPTSGGVRGRTIIEDRTRVTPFQACSFFFPHPRTANMALMVSPSNMVFTLLGTPLRSATMPGGARIRYAEPGRKAGTDRRSTVETTVTERIPEGRWFYSRKFRPEKRSRIGPRGPRAKTERCPKSIQSSRSPHSTSCRFWLHALLPPVSPASPYHRHRVPPPTSMNSHTEWSDSRHRSRPRCLS